MVLWSGGGVVGRGSALMMGNKIKVLLGAWQAFPAKLPVTLLLLSTHHLPPHLPPAAPVDKGSVFTSPPKLCTTAVKQVSNSA